MKVLLIVLVVIAIFFGCAALGYNLANQVHNQPSAAAALAPDPLRGDQHNIVVAQVDRIDSSQPRLVSVWFVSLFFVENASPTLTFAQMYPSSQGTPASVSLGQSFALNDAGEPTDSFWDAVRKYNVQWEGYQLVDSVSIDLAFQWISGAGPYGAALEAAQSDSREYNRMLTETCAGLPQVPLRQVAPFNWSTIVPNHFRSNLPMEKALTYWEKITDPKNPVKCEVYLMP